MVSYVQVQLAQLQRFHLMIEGTICHHQNVGEIVTMEQLPTMNMRVRHNDIKVVVYLLENNLTSTLVFVLYLRC